MKYFTVAASLLACAGAEAKTPMEGRMEITRKADMKSVDGSPDTFTGKVTITGQFQRPALRA